ncbi:MAG: DinB family protein [Bacteroidetes bacterium]|nr:DinB family protein [Bacteroidota bacterium]
MQNTSYIFDLDKFFDGGNHWQAGLYQLIEPLTAEQALWKPAPDRHSIWEALLHVNFWKQYAIAYLRGEEKPDANAGNWAMPPAGATDADWQTELTRTRTLHEGLKTVIAALGENISDTESKPSNYIRQIICHDAYHAGQIGLLRVLQGLKPIE